MTIGEDWENAGQDENQSPEPIFPHPIPVRVVFDENQQVNPEFTAWLTYNIPLLGSAVLPQQVCTHRYHRYKAKFLVNFGGAATLYIARRPEYLTVGTNVTPGPTVLPNAFQLTETAAGNVTLPDYDGQQPVYMGFLGTGPVTVSVMDESFGTVQ
jgi:hypothetical protein